MEGDAAPRRAKSLEQAPATRALSAERWRAMNNDQPGTILVPVRRWKIRFGSPAPGGTVEDQAGRGDLPATFQAHEKARLADRRRSPRYRPAVARTWVGWWSGARFFIGQAELVNL